MNLLIPHPLILLLIALAPVTPTIYAAYKLRTAQQTKLLLITFLVGVPLTIATWFSLEFYILAYSTFHQTH